MKVSFTGTGCSGKSTLLKLCQEKYGDKFEYVTEVTRPIARKGLTINEGGDDNTQRAIIDAHINNNRLKDVIMDRCIIDGLVYTNWLYKKGKVDHHTHDYAYRAYIELIKDLDIVSLAHGGDIVFHTEPVSMVDDGERSTSFKFQTEIYNLFKHQLERLRYDRVNFTGKIVNLEGSVDKRFNDIIMTLQTYECNAR